MIQKKHEDKSPLKTLREGCSLTQPELGRLIGVSDRNIRDWEGGMSIPRLDRAVALARVLGVPLKVLCKAMKIDVEGVPDDQPLIRIRD
jgi:DNA-binding XRE family transcriptional regulator